MGQVKAYIANTTFAGEDCVELNATAWEADLGVFIMD